MQCPPSPMTPALQVFLPTTHEVTNVLCKNSRVLSPHLTTPRWHTVHQSHTSLNVHRNVNDSTHCTPPHYLISPCQNQCPHYGSLIWQHQRRGPLAIRSVSQRPYSPFLHTLIRIPCPSLTTTLLLTVLTNSEFITISHLTLALVVCVSMYYLFSMLCLKTLSFKLQAVCLYKYRLSEFKFECDNMWPDHQKDLQLSSFACFRSLLLKHFTTILSMASKIRKNNRTYFKMFLHVQ